MPTIKVAAGVVNQTPMAWESNQDHIIQAIRLARNEGVSILCLPELAVSGYGCEDYFFAGDLVVQAQESLLHIAGHCSGMVVSVGLPVLFQNRLYNAACLIVNKQIAGFYCKQHLANNGLHYEKRWFHAWPKGVVETIYIHEIAYPIGDIVFELGSRVSGRIRLAFEICEDAWVADRPGKRHYDRGADLILNPSASHFAFHKFETRERLVVEGSRAFSCSYIYTNLLGNEAGQAVYDGDAMVAAAGNLLASGPRFSYEDYFIVPATIDTGLSRLQQVQSSAVIQGEKNWKVSAHFDFPALPPLPGQRAVQEAFETGGFLKEEEFARAVSLALFDYLRKSRSRGFTISLSGGADSCACTALAGLMIRLADESIGLERLKDKLDYIPALREKTTIGELAGALIQTIYQGTRNSSTDTLDSAQSLAAAIGATFYEVDIDPLVASYSGLIEAQLQRKLTWETDDVALQNIQARVRAPGAWMLANISGNLLLATSNRSEVAVGYATMDGDTAGSISPIAGIDKYWLRKWLLWLETVGCEVKGKHIRIEGLKQVNQLQPTAELRPQSRRQTDEDDLMPYDVLNSLENAAIRDKKTPVDCYEELSATYKDQSTEQLVHWTELFFTLWSRNQWKRERYAPSFHLDDHNLNPRSWCRFPILSGGFKKELQELHHHVHGNPKKRRHAGIGF